MEEQGYENNNSTVGGEQQSMEKQYSRDTLERKPGPWDISEEELPEELKVVPALHFFLYQVVFAIPLVGLISAFSWLLWGPVWIIPPSYKEEFPS